MIRNITQPIKVIDNFFENPQLVVNHAIKQDYVDQDNSLFLGTRSTTLDMINHDMFEKLLGKLIQHVVCLLYTSPSPRDQRGSRMPSSA